MTLKEALVATNNKDVMQAILESVDIVVYGFVVEVLGKGVARVAFSVKKDGETLYAPCTILNYKTRNINVNQDISKGDKLLIFVMKDFNANMFRENRSVYPVDKPSYSVTSLVGIPFGMNNAKSKVEVFVDTSGAKVDYYKSPGDEEGAFEEIITTLSLTDTNVTLDVQGNTLVMDKEKTVIGGNLEVLV